MPGANYFTDWREELVNTITKYRETDTNLRDQTEKKSLHIC